LCLGVQEQCGQHSEISSQNKQAEKTAGLRTSLRKARELEGHHLGSYTSLKRIKAKA
jgi:hypothetical protein